MQYACSDTPGQTAFARDATLADGDDVGDMPGRVPRRVEHAYCMAAEGEGISLAHLFVDAGDFRRFVAWTDDGAAGLGFEGGIAAGMVAVMMGGEDVRELPALQFQRGPRTALASGASIEAVRLAPGSWISTP